jgi:hypothetical protein
VTTARAIRTGRPDQGVSKLPTGRNVPNSNHGGEADQDEHDAGDGHVLHVIERGEHRHNPLGWHASLTNTGYDRCGVAPHPFQLER